jgi:hypothetical protein
MLDASSRSQPDVAPDVGRAVDSWLRAADRYRAATSRAAALRAKRDHERAAAAMVLADAIAAGRLPEHPDPAVLARIAGTVRSAGR